MSRTYRNRTLDNKANDYALTEVKNYILMSRSYNKLLNNPDYVLRYFMKLTRDKKINNWKRSSKVLNSLSRKRHQQCMKKALYQDGLDSL